MTVQNIIRSFDVIVLDSHQTLCSGSIRNCVIFNQSDFTSIDAELQIKIFGSEIESMYLLGRGYIQLQDYLIKQNYQSGVLHSKADWKILFLTPCLNKMHDAVKLISSILAFNNRVQTHTSEAHAIVSIRIIYK